MSWATLRSNRSRGSGIYQVSFPAAGTYSYYCSIHGSPGTSMFGTITVQ